MQACLKLAALVLGGMVAGCAAKGTKPEDMSAAEHLAASEGEERTAAEHEAQFDRHASLPAEPCSGGGQVCWKSTVNPTAEHDVRAREHKALAAKHREASQALVDAERRSCAGISDQDRDMSPFVHRDDIVSVSPYERDDIVSVSPYERDETRGKQQRRQLAGATVVFRAVPGLTQQWLQRVLNCHAARNAVLGDTMPDCPLSVKTASASVRTLPDGFAVDVHAADGAAAKAILERAKRLTGG